MVFVEQHAVRVSMGRRHHVQEHRSSCHSRCRRYRLGARQQLPEAHDANPKLEPTQLAEVKKLRADGETLHKQGKHAESEAALGQAETILGIKKM